MSVDLPILVHSFSCVVSALVTDDIEHRDLTQVQGLLADAARMQAAAEAVRLKAAARVEFLSATNPSVDPSEVIARESRAGRRQADRTSRRAKVADQMPELSDLLAGGQVSADHLDVVAQALARLEPDERARLVSDAEWIASVAEHCTPEELARKLRKRVRQLSTDDGIARFERQRRANSLRSWVDTDTGMYRLAGEFDPENGAKLMRLLQRTVDRLFQKSVPDTCPDDDRKHGHLTALALMNLVTRTGASDGGTSHPEFLVVIDHQTLFEGLHAKSRIEVDGGFDLPLATLRRMACMAEIIPVVLNGDGVALDVGRGSRLATPAQRRALRAMYSTCGAPGCSVAFENCDVHHILYWENLGRSDMDNFVPLCAKHHYFVHEGAWQLQLGPNDRVLTITKPDGTTRANPPPYAHVA